VYESFALGKGTAQGNTRIHETGEEGDCARTRTSSRFLGHGAAVWVWSLTLARVHFQHAYHPGLLRLSTEVQLASSFTIGLAPASEYQAVAHRCVPRLYVPHHSLACACLYGYTNEPSRLGSY
jgi:hypothetical protein